MLAGRLLLMTLGLGGTPATITVPEPIQLIYVAPPECPDTSAFVAAVRARAPDARFAGSDVATARLLRVTIEPTGAGFSGRLEVSAETNDYSRQFVDSRCAEVMSALALVAAMAIGAPDELPGASVDTTTPLPPQEGRQPHRRASAGFGLSFLSVWGPAPQPLRTIAPQSQIGWPVGAQWHLDLTLTAAYAVTGTLGPSTEGGSFRWQALRLGLCPSRALGHGFHLGPCFVGDVGALLVEGRSVPTRLEANRPWVGVGPGAELAWVRGAELRLSGAALVPLVRDSFVILPERQLVHEPEAVGGSVALTVGMRFP